MSVLFDILPALLWAALWWIGGWLLALAFFRLRRNETAVVGFAIGLVLEVWLANLLAHVLPVLLASLLSAVLLLVAGAVAVRALHRPMQVDFPWRLWIVFGALFLVFTLIGRGLGIFDDY